MGKVVCPYYLYSHIWHHDMGTYIKVSTFNEMLNIRYVFAAMTPAGIYECTLYRWRRTLPGSDYTRTTLQVVPLVVVPLSAQRSTLNAQRSTLMKATFRGRGRGEERRKIVVIVNIHMLFERLALMLNGVQFTCLLCLTCCISLVIYDLF